MLYSTQHCHLFQKLLWHTERLDKLVMEEKEEGGSSARSGKYLSLGDQEKLCKEEDSTMTALPNRKNRGR